MSRKTSNPAPAFGSAERRRMYGAQEGGYRSGARADQKRAARARGRSALTKKGADQLAGVLEADADFQANLRASKAEAKALTRILGPTGRTQAVKIAKEHGTFTLEDVAVLAEAGWQVRPASTVPAKLGATLGPKEVEAAFNPSALDPARILGPKLEARAVVLAHARAVIDADTVRQLREAGYDVSPAPKGAREGALQKAASNPSGKERHGSDTSSSQGRNASSMAKSRTKSPKKASTAKPKAKAGAKSARKPVTPSAAPQAPAKVQPLRSRAADIHRLRKGLEKAAKAAQPKASKLSSKAPRLQVEKVTVTSKAINPTTANRLEKAWTTWTGSKPGQVHMVKVAAARVSTPAGPVHLPSEVVFLGRLSKLITKRGEVKDFGRSGPYLVSDAELEHLWLLSPKPHRFHLKDLSLIGYLAKKPKFGDREPVEYVHAFEGPTQAAMVGQVGRVKGSFHLTPRGIEG